MLQWWGGSNAVLPAIQREILGAQTSDTSPFVVKNAENTTGIHGSWKGFDGALTNPAAGTGTVYGFIQSGNTSWWQITFPQPRYIVGVSIYGNYESNGYHNCGAFRVKGSNNEIDWTLLYTRTATTRLSGSWSSYSFVLFNWFLHYRIEIDRPTNVAANVYGTGFHEIKFTELTYI